MSNFEQIEWAYINWREGRGLPPHQSIDYVDVLATDGSANNGQYQAATTSDRRRAKRGRRGGRSRGKNKNPQETALVGQNQVQETTESLPMTPAEREAAAAHFWATATPATLSGFPSNSEILAANLVNETRNRSASQPLVHTNHFQEVHRPVEEDENLFDPDVSAPRAAAILGGFVERREDVGKKKKNWVREWYIYADECDEPVVEDETESNDHQQGEAHDHEQKQLTTNGMKKWEWYGKKLRKDAARDARKAAKRKGRDKVAGNTNDRQPPGDDNSGSIGYDHGGFQDTEEFYAEPAPKVKKFNPEALVFEPGCKPGGG